jgi:hypothetical protein
LNIGKEAEGVIALCLFMHTDERNADKIPDPSSEILSAPLSAYYREIFIKRIKN